MTQEDEVALLAYEMQKCAEKSDFETLANLMPTPEQFSEFMLAIFSNKNVVDQYEKQVLDIKSSES